MIGRCHDGVCEVDTDIAEVVQWGVVGGGESRAAGATRAPLPAPRRTAQEALNTTLV
jgi:hypothetical protein